MHLKHEKKKNPEYYKKRVLLIKKQIHLKSIVYVKQCIVHRSRPIRSFYTKYVVVGSPERYTHSNYHIDDFIYFFLSVKL